MQNDCKIQTKHHLHSNFFWACSLYIGVRHLELNEGTERKSNDSFFFWTIPFSQKELNGTRNEAKFGPSRSVPLYIYSTHPHAWNLRTNWILGEKSCGKTGARAREGKTWSTLNTHPPLCLLPASLPHSLFILQQFCKKDIFACTLSLCKQRVALMVLMHQPLLK